MKAQYELTGIARKEKKKKTYLTLTTDRMREQSVTSQSISYWKWEGSYDNI